MRTCITLISRSASGHVASEYGETWLNEELVLRAGGEHSAADVLRFASGLFGLRLREETLDWNSALTEEYCNLVAEYHGRLGYWVVQLDRCPF